MKFSLTIVFVLAFSFCSLGQVIRKSCNCPKDFHIQTSDNTYQTIPDTTFHFANGKSVILCGYKDTETIKGQMLFSEFILAVCGQDTIIDFWGAVQTCKLRVNKDTLFIEDIKYLPIGKNLIYRETVWTIEKIYFAKGMIVRKLSPNLNIRKYTAQEIQNVIKEYETISKDSLEKAEILFDKLFMATISGDKRARTSFMSFKSKFPYLGEHFNEEFDATNEMLSLWDKNQKRSSR